MVLRGMTALVMEWLLSTVMSLNVRGLHSDSRMMDGLL
jgi:hypothetical protein